MNIRKKQMVTKNPTETIYQCLGSAFWTERKCWDCQQIFTKADYEKHNYYLTFQEILKVWKSKDFPEPRDNACLEGVIVKLFHQECLLNCSFTRQSNTIYKEVKK